ncbi:EAL domain-containing protein [Gymnodinialimonas sp. 2305UL16-5]|uniref:EAL domain-containing protein n=1 Tax=Gymnodinialimonas mytili TaxID=3126503 RepID=UPI00309AD154
MHFLWANERFCRTLGYRSEKLLGSRGTILIGANMSQATHLYIIERLMSWEEFSVSTPTNMQDGTPIQVEMCWTPLSDHVSGDRWWLCALSEQPRLNDGPKVANLQKETSTYAPIVELQREIGRLKKDNQRLHNLSKMVARESNRDPLTGLSNRRHYGVQLREWIEWSKVSSKDFAVIYVDLDHFKLVNDNFGHEAGDQVLISTAETLREICNPTDFIARIGGDEFVIFRELSQSALSISGLADQIVEAFGKPQEFDGGSVTISASVGISLGSLADHDPEQVVSQADIALFKSKENGRGHWSFFTPLMHTESIEKKRLSAEILVACERKEFFPVFQPVVDALTGEISSAEALMRWQHPTRGVLPPSAFLDVANRTGLIGRIDQIVFEKVCQFAKETDLFTLGLPRVSINVSSGRLSDPSFLHEVLSSGIEPNRLCVEILESTYLDRPTVALRKSIESLRRNGILIAVDDFGMGHTSLQGLLQIEPDLMKVDRQFIKPLLDSERNKLIVQSLFGIAEALDIRVVAEGVETEALAMAATELGCEYLQGFHFSRPLSCEQLCSLLAKTRVFRGHKSAQAKILAEDYSVSRKL